MRKFNYPKTFLFVLLLFSCDKLKRKGNEAIDTTKEKANQVKQKVYEEKKQLVKKYFPSNDYDKPDSEGNKKRFIEYLAIDITTDVKNIYTYDDFFGADYSILVAFNCDDSTAKKLIAAKGMQLSPEEHDVGLSFSDDFPWWHEDKIAKINPYKIGKADEYWKYLWYDKKTKTAYYEEFSL
jgi:hypothetical protein